MRDDQMMIKRVFLNRPVVSTSNQGKKLKQHYNMTRQNGQRFYSRIV